MLQLRLTSAFIAAGAVAGLATPASAIVAFHYHATHKAPAPTPPSTSKPPKQAGSWGSGGCCGGGPHAGGGSSHTVWTKPRLGDHPKGLHFYGMGRGSIHFGVFVHGRIGPGYGGPGGGGTGASHPPPPGMHPIGMHYYGMGGDSLAARYGHLEHDFGTPLHLSQHWGGGWQGSPAPTPPAKGPPKSPPPKNPPPSPSAGGSHNWVGHGHQWSGGSWGHESWGRSHAHWGHGSHWGSSKPTPPVASHPPSGPGGSHHEPRRARGGVYAIHVLLKERFGYKISWGGKSSHGSHGGGGSSGGHWGSSNWGASKSHGSKPKTWFYAVK